MQKGTIFIVSAPSGCGKGTILSEILKDGKYWYSISATTRAPREGEQDGVQYYFLTEEKFTALLAENAFLESAAYCGHHYGTLKAPIEEHLSRGQHVILEIEVQGTMQIQQQCPEAVSIFIAPPDVETLRQRLTGRGTEPPEVIAERVAQAQREMQFREKYTYCLVNDVLADAVADFRAIVRAEELKVRR